MFFENIFLLVYISTYSILIPLNSVKTPLVVCFQFFQWRDLPVIVMFIKKYSHFCN